VRVLITNASLTSFGGTEVYVRDLAGWLLDHGHSPVVYAPRLGEAATQLRRRAIPVTDDLATIAAAPDVIHGNSPVETMTAMLHFPDTPAISVCHGWFGPALRFPRIFRYVAVDDTCRDRLLLEEGIPEEKLVVILNAVDPARFHQRGPLPSRPRRALVFSNLAHELTHLPMIREACSGAGIELDAIGFHSGGAVSDPEKVLGSYDLVFAKAKCALEAMAAGTAVILCDVAGLGGMVRLADVPRLRRLNFGLRALTGPLSVDAIRSELLVYDPNDARKVSDLIRSTACADPLHESLFSLYEEAIRDHRQSARTDWSHGESRAAADFIRRLMKDHRRHEESVNLLLGAARRVLGTPAIGPALTRVANWMAKKASRGRLP
jgi:hypothetical protein